MKTGKDKNQTDARQIWKNATIVIIFHCFGKIDGTFHFKGRYEAFFMIEKTFSLLTPLS